MKRIASLLLVLSLALSLCACGGSSGSASSESASGSTGSASQSSSGSSSGSSSDASSVSSSGSDSASAPGVASSSQMAPAQELNTDGLTPMDGSALRDGTYDIQVECSSSMFPITSCALTVSNGQMTAVLTMGGTGYLKVYPGTAEEAAAAADSDTIPFEETADGAQTYTIPVSSLNTPVPLAAFSKNKELWYDRDLLFRADSLPMDAFQEGTFPTVESLALADGSYTVNVTLAGGSGKASVESPAQMTVSGGRATAVIVWSSSNYDYMVVDGERYDLLNTDGNSTFEIPVSCFDFTLPVLADTIAMSTPHEIEYTLTFDSSSIQPAS